MTDYRTLVRGALTERPQHRVTIARKIADETGLPLSDVQGTVFATLSQLKKDGDAVTHDRGYWSLSEREQLFNRAVRDDDAALERLFSRYGDDTKVAMLRGALEAVRERSGH